ncbi:MAG: hypothetical protein AABY93_12885 [Bacteroidota bacterium]
MKFIGKAVVVFIIFGAISIIFLTWHSIQHSEDEEDPREKELLQRVLIATESDKSEDSVVTGIISQLTSPSIDIHLIEIDQLNLVNEHDWSAIVILSAPESLTTEKEVPVFIKNTEVKDKILLIRASGSTVAIVDIDEINTTAINENLSATPDEIVSRIKSMFNK